MILGDADRPAVRWRRAGRCDVAADAHEHATRRVQRRRCGGDVGRERLGGGAVVELDARRQADRGVRVVELDAAPAAGPAKPDRTAGADRREVAVVSGGAHRGADRRVQIAVGQPGGAQGAAGGADEQPADAHRGPAGGVEPAQLGVVAEAAAGAVDLVEHAVHGRGRLR